MSSFLDRPAWVSNFNQFGPASGGAEKLIPLEPEALKRHACEATGLSDFGDVPWEKAFEKLLWSLNHEAHLNALGRLRMRAELLRTLQVRLRLAAFWKTHPDVLESEVKAPIIIAGAARTGTTILQEVLSQDEQFHLPYTWKCLDPLPLGPDPQKDMAQRIERAKCEADFWVDVQPEIQSMHDFGSQLPTECIFFLSTDYSSDYWAMVAALPTWDAWRIENECFKGVYRWHKRLLQTMQWNEPAERTWLLKSPIHLAFLEELMKVYPGVRYILTHRDPLKCIPSTASVTCTARWQRSDTVDLEAVGQLVAFGFQFALENAINKREDGGLPDAQVADLHLQELTDDPVTAIRNVYEHFNLPFSDQMPAKIIRYLNAKPKGKFGEHSYDMSEFGMTEESLREQYRRYTDYYRIAAER